MTVSLDLEPLKIAVSRLIAKIDQLEQMSDRAIPRPAFDGSLPLRVSAIVSAVAYETGLSPVAICGPRRQAPLFRARAAVCWLSRQATCRSAPQIGMVLGGRDHTSIYHAIDRASEMRATDPAFRRLTDRLLRQFQALKEH